MAINSLNSPGTIKWCLSEVKNPMTGQNVPVIVAKAIPYFGSVNRLQNMNIYLPVTADTAILVGKEATSLPYPLATGDKPVYHVHIHGGAWRDPALLAESVEPTVACLFGDFNKDAPIKAVASLNYTLTEFPLHPANPYDAKKDGHSDSAREAVHPDHVRDVLIGLQTLLSFGFTDKSYILTGHSAGATILFQAILMPPVFYGLQIPDPPCPAAAAGLNGLYDLPALVYDTDEDHELTIGDYKAMLTNTFGKEEYKWERASPALFDTAVIAARIKSNKAPKLILVDQSKEDQLVPYNQKERFYLALGHVEGMSLMNGARCKGKHAQPWQLGGMIKDTIFDLLANLP